MYIHIHIYIWPFLTFSDLMWPQRSKKHYPLYSVVSYEYVCKKLSLWIRFENLTKRVLFWPLVTSDDLTGKKNIIHYTQLYHMSMYVKYHISGLILEFWPKLPLLTSTDLIWPQSKKKHQPLCSVVSYEYICKKLCLWVHFQILTKMTSFDLQWPHMTSKVKKL